MLLRIALLWLAVWFVAASSSFAAIGFASVVSLMPGVFLFGMSSGLLQLANSANATLPLLGGTVADAMSAFTIILAMSFGVSVPKLVIERLQQRSAVGVLSGKETWKHPITRFQ
jgi:hypothetical protein